MKVDAPGVAGDRGAYPYGHGGREEGELQSRPASMGPRRCGHRVSSPRGWLTSPVPEVSLRGGHGVRLAPDNDAPSDHTGEGDTTIGSCGSVSRNQLLCRLSTYPSLDCLMHRYRHVTMSPQPVDLQILHTLANDPRAFFVHITHPHRPAGWYWYDEILQDRGFSAVVARQAVEAATSVRGGPCVWFDG